MTTAGRCSECGRQALLSPLHGDKGGPLMCPGCYGDKRAHIRRGQKSRQRIIEGFGFGRLHAADGELSRELLDDAIRLCHPDKHPPERAETATRVTAELTAMRPYAKPKPPPCDTSPAVESAQPCVPVTPPPHNAFAKGRATPHREPVTLAYPCDDCRHTVPMYYCDSCRAQWEAERAAERERAAAAQRRYRARKRQRQSGKCAECGATFWGRRKDARYCSPTCRQKAHRARSAAR